MKDFLKRLSSRKFLITIGLLTAITLFPTLPDELWKLGLAYLGVEGGVDLMKAYRASKVDVELSRERQVMVENGFDPFAITTMVNKTNPSPVDSGKIVPGAQ